MALATLGGVLKKAGVSYQLWDFDLYFRKVENATEEQLRKLLRHGVLGSQAQVFGISSICSNFPMALWIAREIKTIKPDTLILFGGPQPSSVPKETLERFPFVDAVVAGEGEPALEEMVRTGFDRDHLGEIPGVAVRAGGEIRLNPRRELVSDMDQFPFPDFSQINFQDYKENQSFQFVPSIEVGRGCPFTCTFCSTALMWERDFRVKSPARILAEMEFLHETYGFAQFDFIHDNFTTSKKFISEFCEHMEKHNTKGFQWHSSSRTDCIDVPRLERMHACGLDGLFFGIESGSERMQKVMKKNLQLDNFEPTLKRANELGLKATTAFILGFPEETEADLDATVRRALHYRIIGTARIFFSTLSALTGTSIYRDYVDKLTEYYGSSVYGPQRYALPFVDEVIQKYPDLFSFFYHVPHPLFTSGFLFRFKEFAYRLIERCTAPANTVMEHLGVGAVRMFRLWEAWAEKRGLPYFHYDQYSNQQFQTDFLTFLRETILADPAGVAKGRGPDLQQAV